VSSRVAVARIFLAFARRASVRSGAPRLPSSRTSPPISSRRLLSFIPSRSSRSRFELTRTSSSGSGLRALATSPGWTPSCGHTWPPSRRVRP